MSANLASSLYLLTGVLFILALRGLSSPETSRRGNFFGIIGMILAIGTTLFSLEIFIGNLTFVFGALLIGGSIGTIIAFRI